jgi:ubiquinone biosynthesis accessory factor UbiK
MCRRRRYFTVLDSIDDAKTMAQTSLFEDLSARISEFLAASPAKDLEKNVRALLVAAFAKLDLATREQFEVQTKVLSRTREKLAELERRVVELEARLRQK